MPLKIEGSVTYVFSVVEYSVIYGSNMKCSLQAGVQFSWPATGIVLVTSMWHICAHTTLYVP